MDEQKGSGRPAPARTFRLAGRPLRPSGTAADAGSVRPDAAGTPPEAASCCGTPAATASASGCGPTRKAASVSCCGSSDPSGSRRKPAGQACAAAGHTGAPVNPPRWVTGHVGTPAGDIPLVSTRLEFADIAGSWKCRWSIGRMDYTVEPGLYGLGNPDDRSPVLVTANYKMTFDRVRRELAGLDAWLLVLDTDGINVWCAAGKGTFGTDELVRRIQAVGLPRIVSHRTLILPQLGATGVAAHEVTRQAGFRVIYGPVRAADIQAFLRNGMKASEAMRTMTFPIFARLVLTPMEAVAAIKPLVLTLGVLFLLNAIGLGRYGLTELVALLGAIVAGCVVTPALLPWIPGRAFSFKGFLTGLLWAIALLLPQGLLPAMAAGGLSAAAWLTAIAWLLILPAISAFLAMNFTGSSTYTSLSGVDREMRIALPLMLGGAVIGAILLLAAGIITARV